MVSLGICYGHNATIAVMRDGVLVFCQSEERLNRIKNSTGFPSLTLQHVYRHIARPEEVVSATLFQKSVQGYLHLKRRDFQPYQYGEYLDPALATRGIGSRILRTNWGWALKMGILAVMERNPRLRAEAHRYFCLESKLPHERVSYLDHHLAHAYSVLPNVADWGRALIFTLDGVGDWKCATVNLVEDGKLRVLSETDHHDSLGYYYAAITSLMGMKAGEHEFKVMGLAPYANPAYYRPLVERLASMLRVTAVGGWKSKVNPSRMRGELERLVRFQRFDNIAGAIQQLTENLIQEWIDYWIRRIGCSNIGVTGGVFMNVKACQRLAASPKVDKLFVMPSAADESTAIGCAVWGSIAHDSALMPKPLQSLYLGVSYDDSEIEKAITLTAASERYHVSRLDRINTEIARLLAANEMVARCTGPMEFGARALGNRSILANPSKLENLSYINQAVKSRDFWMPFTPSILEEEMPKYVLGHERIFAPYMSITFDGTELARRDLIAAIHPKDHTLRPQCVVRSWNPDYHELISEFRNLTGIGGILNTSFNLHGEPIVCSPHDAIRTVDNSGLKYLAMGSYLLRKR